MAIVFVANGNITSIDGVGTLIYGGGTGVSPYEKDNWDGITEVLIDPFWPEGQVVMKIYLSILNYISDEWSKKEDFRPGSHCADLVIFSF